MTDINFSGDAKMLRYDYKVALTTTYLADQMLEQNWRTKILNFFSSKPIIDRTELFMQLYGDPASTNIIFNNHIQYAIDHINSNNEKRRKIATEIKTSIVNMLKHSSEENS